MLTFDHCRPHSLTFGYYYFADVAYIIYQKIQSHVEKWKKKQLLHNFSW